MNKFFSVGRIFRYILDYLLYMKEERLSNYEYTDFWAMTNVFNGRSEISKEHQRLETRKYAEEANG